MDLFSFLSSSSTCPTSMSLFVKQLFPTQFNKQAVIMNRMSKHGHCRVLHNFQKEVVVFGGRYREFAQNPKVNFQL